MESESGFMGAVLDLARLCGWRAYHTLDSRGSAAGFPDLVMVRGPVVLFVELKSQAGRVTAEQADWIGDLDGVCEVRTLLWRPSDWPTIEKTLKRRPR